MNGGINLRTKFLFKLLLKVLKPDLLCDTGSMDASEAIWFAKLLPQSRVLLFEANPINFSAIQKKPEVNDRNIQLENKAVWHENGTLQFFVEQPGLESGKEEHLRGISSTKPRKDPEESKGSTTVEVAAVRLDDFVNSLAPSPQAVALWIDVEGASHEVLEGMRDIRQKKLSSSMWRWKLGSSGRGKNSKQKSLSLLRSHGVELLARGRIEHQHDLVLVRKDILHQFPRMIPALVAIVRLLTIDLKGMPLFRRFVRG